jgi:hypothetical protein
LLRRSGVKGGVDNEEEILLLGIFLGDVAGRGME